MSAVGGCGELHRSQVTLSDMQPEEDRRREAILFDLDGVIALSEVQKSEAHIETVLELTGTPSQKLTELYTDVIGLSYEETRDRFLECGDIVATPEVKKAYRELYRSIYRTKLQEAICLADNFALSVDYVLSFNPRRVFNLSVSFIPSD